MREKTRKGLFNMEYFIVLTLFVTFSGYFAFRLLEQQPTYLQEVQNEIYRSESYRLSEILVNDAGHPANWDVLVGTADEDKIKRIGLLDDSKNSTNLLSEEKIDDMNILCSREGGFNTVKTLLGTSYNFSITITDMSRSLGTIECKPPVTEDIKSSIKRLVSFNSGNYGELIVQIW